MSRRWFHPNLNGLEAERLLKENGVEGSFLVRPSTSRAGDFTLSLKCRGEVFHVKIQSNGDCFDLFGKEKFASLNELINYYLKHPNKLRDTSGNTLPVVHPFGSTDPTTERWFHGVLSSPQAEALLMEKGKPGSFLVRESSSGSHDYVISIRLDDNISHLMVMCQGDKFSMGGNALFMSLNDVVDYCRSNPVVDKNGTVITLKQPLLSTRLRASNIAERVKDLAKEEKGDRTGFVEEFEEIQELEGQETSLTRDVGMRPENKDKNRYKNILPYDKTRVVLETDHEDQSDYINANWIDGERPVDKRRYIACQGPLPNTMADMWRMIVQTRGHIIVMVTKEVERGKRKCEKYWPDKCQTEIYGRFAVTCLSEEDRSEYMFRQLEVKNQGSPGEKAHHVSFYHYHAWPDYGVPTDPGPLIGFLSEINLRYKSFKNSGPIVIHCSAGIGRSGTLIVIDAVIQVLQDKGINYPVDLAKAVLAVRQQRSGMVQTEAQYRFLYLTLDYFVSSESRRQGSLV